ncbi:BID domain-containing protein [Mesorhizobium xinjiangense]|uniref:BID domain-containing protein n=1 Tax=Mesorhizobium xinjiangense TaxID=2678685 RepID=UPI002E25AF9D
MLVGDAEQLQPIEAGAAFRAIVERTGYAELETIYRQKDAWMRTASLDLARGNVKAALSAYKGHGMVIGHKLKAQAVESLIASWNREYDPEKSTLILSHLRRDVRELNRLAREKLVERSIVGEGHAFQTEDGTRHFDAGDQIVFLRNEGALGVKNGMIGRVVEAEPGRIVAEIGDGQGNRRIEVEERFYRNLDLGYATTIHKSQGATVDRVKVLASLSLDRHLTYVAMTRHREELQLFYGERSFQIAGGLDALLSRRNAKETTLDYATGRFYRQALSFANNRGLHLMRVARTLARDRLDWTLRQKRRLADLGRKLRAVGTRIGLFDTTLSVVQSKKEAEPMVKGVTTFAKSVTDVAAERIHAEKEVARQWEEVSDRFRLVFADPEAAFRAMRFDAVLADPATASERLNQLAREPASIGALRGREGLLAGRSDREARREANANIPALGREIERYLRLREAATRRLEADEKALRRRVSIDIPALSPAARVVLEKVRDAMDRNDLSAALGFALADRMAKAEIEGFNNAVSERFGERTLLSIGARETDDTVFRKQALGLPATEREQLAAAWPMMRAGQQLAAHERTVKALKEGVVAAYEHIVGESWKPYERQAENPGQTVSRQAADLQMAALG